MFTPDELRVIAGIAVDAGQAILDIYQHGGVGVSSKPDQSPLTEADLSAHRLITSALASSFANDVVWSEEGEQPTTTSPSERFFLVDPLDGTKEFISRNGEFTVNIALVENGVPTAGVVYAPALDQLYFAARGIGAFRRDGGADTPLHTRAPQPGEPLRVIGSRSHAGEGLASWLQRLSRPHTFVAAGSSLKFCRLAEGAADVYPRHGPTCQWDTAAGQAILECAGGVVRDPQGRDLRYGLDRPRLNPHFIALASADVAVPPML